MKTKKHQHAPLLALDPTVRGCGYVVFEGPRNPVDWGVFHVRICKNQRILKRIHRLITLHDIEVIVTENPHHSLRCSRVKTLLAAIKEMAERNKIACHMYTKDDVRQVFGEFGKTRRHDIATVIAEWLPELETRLPRKRKIFEPENEQYGVFDAASLGLVHMYLNE